MNHFHHELQRVSFFLTLTVASVLFATQGNAQTKSSASKLPVSADATIHRRFGDSDIVITTTSRLAGAIHSLKWDGIEFIDSLDHGRQLQSASNLDAGSRMTGETFNPTEAGSRNDSAGPTSTSRLLHLIAEKNTLQTTTQMAFWLQPGQKSSGNPAKNKTVLSNHLLTKRVTIGYANMPNVIQYDVTFGLPINEHHKYAQFEVVTGYMPTRFSRFLVYDAKTQSTAPISDGPGEQPKPVILSTKSGSHAMGVLARQNQTGVGPGYGRFRFRNVVKWNCVFRVRDRIRVQPTDFRYRTFVIVGRLTDVVASLNKLKAIQATTE